MIQGMIYNDGEQMNNWEKLCEVITALRNENVKEAPFHKSFIAWLKIIFNWKNENIEREVSAKKDISGGRADILLKGKDFEVVIEMKDPDKGLNDVFEAQLKAYMQRMPWKYGLLIGFEITLFYKNKNEIEKIITIDFDADDEDGKELGDLLDSTVCSNDKLEHYCKKDRKIKLKKEKTLEDKYRDILRKTNAHFNANKINTILTDGKYCFFQTGTDKEFAFWVNKNETEGIHGCWAKTNNEINREWFGKKEKELIEEYRDTNGIVRITANGNKIRITPGGTYVRMFISVDQDMEKLPNNLYELFMRTKEFMEYNILEK